MGWIALAAAAIVPPAQGGELPQSGGPAHRARGLEWLAAHQSRVGHWTANESRYPVAMTGMAGIAFLAEGSTTTQGRYASTIRRAVDYLVSHSRPNGLIGDPLRDDRYTYGHGFAMLFLSQVLGEEEDIERRKQLVDVLTRAVTFTGQAQTEAGGWGYVSAKDGQGFDEGSTTITQVQGLRGCRNAGIPVPKEIIDKAIQYIRNCTTADGGVQYNSRGGGPRQAITAAAIACLFNAGDYDSKYVPKLLDYCKRNLTNLSIRVSGIGTMPITITPKCCTARAARRGRNIATKLRRNWSAKPAPTARGARATSARYTRRPSTSPSSSSKTARCPSINDRPLTP